MSSPVEQPPDGGNRPASSIGANALAVFLATGFGAGYSPLAPGTAGTLVAVSLVMLLMPAGFVAQAVVIAAVGAVAIWSAGAAAPTFGLKDPGQIVVDEIAGFFVTMAFLPVSAVSLAVGFVLFRIFDIVKPPPCRWAEALPGGLGIVADDLWAGLYANLVIRMLCIPGILSL